MGATVSVMVPGDAVFTPMVQSVRVRDVLGITGSFLTTAMVRALAVILAPKIVASIPVEAVPA